MLEVKCLYILQFFKPELFFFPFFLHNRWKKYNFTGILWSYFLKKNNSVTLKYSVYI